MRSKTKDNITVTYPEEWCYVFNEQYITVTSSELRSVVVRVVGGKSTASVMCYLLNGSGKVFITDMLKMVFVNPTKQRCVSAGIYVYYGDNHDKVLLNTTIYAIYGKMEEGDVFPSFGEYRMSADNTMQYVRHLVWFKKYPFSVSLYGISGNYTVDAIIDGSRHETLHSGHYIYDMPIDLDAEKSIDLIIRRGSRELQIFDNTFDYTFIPTYGNEMDEVIHIDVYDEEQGHYIRWIDRFGYMNYYLFKSGKVDVRTSKSKETVYSDEENEIEIPVSVYVETTVSCAAVEVYRDVLPVVDGIRNANFVEIYHNGVWESIKVKVSDTHDGGLGYFEVPIEYSYKTERQAI